MMMIHILTAAFAVGSFVIIKKKRFKMMPFMSFVILISFVGFGSASLLSIILPEGESSAYSLCSITLGLQLLLVGMNDVCSLMRCKEKIAGVYCGYRTYSGARGISVQSPVFRYTYNGKEYHEQTAQNIPYKTLNYKMIEGNSYDIYVNPKHPAVYILSKKLETGTILVILLGVLFLGFGAVSMNLTEENDLDQWIGHYRFEECYNDESGLFMVMDYELEIYKDEGKCYGNLEIIGQLTWVTARVEVRGNSEQIALVFLENLQNEHGETREYHLDGVLFRLRQEDGRIETYWENIQPAFTGNISWGEYFKAV